MDDIINGIKKLSIDSNIDPDTNIIRNICNDLIGSKINIGFTITLINNRVYQSNIPNCNIIGNCMENIIFPIIKEHIPTFEEGPKQKSPDFFNGKWEYELKCFTGTPNFDISNFNSYIRQLEENVERKLYRTKYIIFQYEINDNIVMITDFKLCNIWEIILYTGKYPISIQNKKDIWYNIRPCRLKDMNDIGKTPSLFIEKICDAILKTPNKIKNKREVIKTISDQFANLNNQYD